MSARRGSDQPAAARPGPPDRPTGADEGTDGLAERGGDFDRAAEPDDAAPSPHPVSAAALEALDADDWARVLPLLRAALHDLDEAGAGRLVRRLRAAPAGRLASGPLRRELCALVTSDPAVRAAVGRRLAAAGLPEELRGRLRAEHPGAADPRGGRDRELERLAGRLRKATDRAERASERLRRTREARDHASRRAEGAEARALAAEQEAGRLHDRVAELEEELARARGALDDAEGRRRRAVDRERRRVAGELDALREEVRELRRADEDRRAAERERSSRRAGPSGEGDAAQGPPAAPRVVPGRPTRLPETVASGTAEEVDLLLDRGRIVLVDGYNVTLQHRPQLDLAAQRDWLVRHLATVVARRRVRPLVVFDGERASGARPTAGVREVEVRFTAAGITADDELLFAVEALPPDVPVLAVTDDRELVGRLAARGVDVVGTGPFLWAT